MPSQQRPPGLFCPRPEVCRSNEEALPAQRRPAPASAAPTPAPQQGLDVVGVDVLPAWPHPILWTEPRIPEPRTPTGRVCVSRLPGAVWWAGGTHTAGVHLCPRLTTPRFPERKHAASLGLWNHVLLVLVPSLPPSWPGFGGGECFALSRVPARGQGSDGVTALCPAGVP